MNQKEVAVKLDGIEYADKERTMRTMHNELEAAGLVVAYPDSDDLLELRGAMTDELDAYRGTTVKLDADGLVTQLCEDENCPHEKERKRKAPFEIVLKQSWEIETNIPNAEPFAIVEDEEPYGVGIVFSIHDLKGASNAG